MSAYMNNLTNIEERWRHSPDSNSPRKAPRRGTVQLYPTVLEMGVIRRNKEDTEYSKSPLLYNITQ